MRTLTTFTARLACPTCAQPAPRTVAIVQASDGDWGSWEARVHECVRCWHRRAAALGAARAKLRASGELAHAPDGLPTWRGVPVREGGHDPISGAMLSELLRQGLSPASPETLRLDAATLGLLTATRTR